MKKQEKNGIWYFADLLPYVPPQHRLTLNEGHTPFREIDNVFFKCEYENPTGSHKDRAMAYQVSKLYERGIKKAVISSSGNAAISAANYCQLAGCALTVFVSQKINVCKLSVLQKLSCRTVTTAKPKKAAFQFAKANNAHNLRQSTDENALYGYMTLAYELVEKEKNIDAVFFPVSGGASIVGLTKGYTKLGREVPAIHVVQTEAVNPVSSLFDKKFTPQKTSLAAAIVARYSPLLQQIIELVKKTKGFGWVISDDEMLTSRKWLISKRLNCSYEGAAALAAYWKAESNGFKYKKPVVVLTGKDYEQ